MRTLRTPAHRMFVPTQRFVHYRMDEATPADFIDLSGLNFHIPANSSPPCPHPCLDSDEGRSPVNTTGAGLLCTNITATQRTSYLGNSFAAYGWASPSNVAGVGGPLMHYGGDGSGGPGVFGNQPVYLSVSLVGGEMTVSWTDVSSLGPTWNVTTNTTVDMGLGDNETFFWAVSVCEEYRVALPGVAPPGTVRLEVMIYNVSTGEFKTEVFPGLFAPHQGVAVGFFQTTGINICLLRDMATSTLQGCFADMGIMTECVSEAWVYDRVTECEAKFFEEPLVSVQSNGCWSWPRLCVRARFRRNCTDPWALVTPPGNSAYDFLVSASWGGSVGNKISNATIELAREVWDYNIAPGIFGFLQQIPALTSRPMLDCKVQVQIQSVLLPPVGDIPEYLWRTDWQGFIERASVREDVVQLDCGDQCVELRDAQLSHRVLYWDPADGPTPAPPTAVPTDESFFWSNNALTPGPLDVVLQYLIDIALRDQNEQLGNPAPPYTYIGCSRPEIWNPFAVTQSAGPFKTEKCVSVLDELNRIAGAAGADVRCLYDEDTGRFRPALFVPGQPAQAVAVHRFEPEHIHAWTDANYDCSNLRNFISVFSGPEDGVSPNALGDSYRAAPPAIADDAASIDRYGYLAAKIGEDSQTSPIQPGAGDAALAASARDYLSRVGFAGTFEHPYFPHPALGDRVIMAGDGKRFSSAFEAIITGFAHQASISAVRSRFTLQLLP